MQATSAPTQAETTRRLALLVRHLMTTSGRDFLQAIDELELSLTQLKMLNLLWEEQEFALKDLGDQLGLSLPAVSRAVDGLVQRGLLTRVEDSHDRRMKRVGLSRKGRKLAEDLIQLRFAGLDKFVAALSSRERTALDRALDLLCEREELR